MSPSAKPFAVVVLDDYQGVASSLAPWSELGDGVEVTFVRQHLATAEDVVTTLQGADAVVAMRERTAFPRSVLERLPGLRLLVTTGSRNAAIDVDACAELGITVCHTGDPGRTTVEMTWALILAWVRRLPAETASLRSGGWMTSVGGDLEGATLGVLGLGRLGEQVARIGQAFGMEVIAWSQNLTAERCAEVGATLVSREELFQRSDVLTIHLVLSRRTRGLVGADELRSMKPSALLVNTSRGPIVDEGALVRACAEGWIGGAALDVYDTEPLPVDHPFRSLDRVLATPHVGYVTERTYRDWYGRACEDVVAFRAGEPIRVLAAGNR